MKSFSRQMRIEDSNINDKKILNKKVFKAISENSFHRLLCPFCGCFYFHCDYKLYIICACGYCK